MTPIIMLAGQAGSGKDTVAAFLKKKAPTTVSIAQADPLKRFAAAVFGFTEEQLWGPSECRNALDPRFEVASIAWWKAADAIGQQIVAWAAETGLKGVTEKDGVDWLNQLANLSNHQLSPRIALQHLGTEFGRARDQDVWCKYALKTATKLLKGGWSYSRELGAVKDAEAPLPEFVVITDGRFPNEVLMTNMVGGITLKVVPVDTSTKAAPGLKAHASETELAKIPPQWFSGLVLNDKARGLASLEAYVARIVDKLRYVNWL